jgi:hypothetical protein
MGASQKLMWHGPVLVVVVRTDQTPLLAWTFQSTSQYIPETNVESEMEPHFVRLTIDDGFVRHFVPETLDTTH